MASNKPMSVHDALARHVERASMPGAVALVRRAGLVEIVAVGSTGTTPMEENTIFRISSMTKPITAVATMVLVEEGAIRLDDPVDRLLPELAGQQVLRNLSAPIDETVPLNRPITIRDLLTFTLGFGIVMTFPPIYPIQAATDAAGLGQGPPSPLAAPDPDEWMRRFGALPLICQPGEQWMYNTGADVLGVLIARAAGQPLPDVLRDRIFDPLDMRDTGFSVPESKRHRFTPQYAPDLETGTLSVVDDPATGQWSADPSFPAGGSGLVSTADDFGNFAEMLQRGGSLHGTRVLSRRSVEPMTSDQLTAAQKAASSFSPGFFDRFGWGFGMAVVTRRIDLFDSVGSYGWNGGLGSSWRNDPSEDVTTALFTPCMWSSATPPPIFADFSTAAYASLAD